MNWHDFVFSEKTSHRYTRHIVFWLNWWFYSFVSMNFLMQQANAPQKIEYSFQNFHNIIHSVLILAIHVFACYALVYFLLPRYLLKARYFLFMAGLVVLGFFMVQASRFVDTIVVPLINKPANQSLTPYYTSVFTGLINGIKIIAAAAAIKLVKHWWLKQKEKERLEKEKIETELQLLKSQIHPAFLFNTLNNIYSFSLTSSPKAPEMLLKLSDILSYMLYDCSDKEVPVDKEIKMLKDYMTLEQIRFGDKLEMNIRVTGETRHEKIAPLLLIRFIENSFNQCNNRMTAQPWINLEIDIENHVLHVKLMNGKSAILSSANDEFDDNLIQAKRRLELLYPGNHELIIMSEPEIMLIDLKINLITGNNIKETLVRKQELLYENG